MKSNFDKCLAEVLRHEGGFVDHPRDPGGATNKGITIGTFRQYRPGATVAQLKAISDAEVAMIYRNGYWDAVRGDDLPSGLDLVAFDAAVNSGPRRGAQWLQRALGVADDGKIGPVTLSVAQASEPMSVISRALDIRLAFLKSLSHWDAFGRGWSARVVSVRKVALQMASVSKQATPAPQVTTSPAGGILAAILQWLRSIFK